MAEQLLDQVRDIAEGQIDFEGQRLCDWLATVLLSSVGALSFIIGCILQDIKLAVYIALGGSALVSLIIIPPWPFFKKHPVKWLPIGGGSSSNNINVPQTVVIDEKAIR
ncbi:Microsomal signal peptidase 12kDa subunit [Niveomyces insectorum RCEF 264]|uniref:Signal peptidase complex subunit 1 n=1 Tax=Niveomyces insectorum RCEF 264 TaxID=1081102 RepID=A0A167QR97_9HYPO|nr:Microsomal signal peptidase 12kDa subunit [Niveomyces insectorum RCEF 264]